jgi:hypothetical protein
MTMQLIQENFYNTLRRLSSNVPSEKREKASEFIRIMDMQAPTQAAMLDNGAKYLKEAGINPPPEDVFEYASIHSFVFFTEAKTVLINARQKEASHETGVTVTNFDYEEKLAWSAANILFFILINNPTITKQEIMDTKVSFSNSLSNIFNDDRVFSVSIGFVLFLISFVGGPAGAVVGTLTLVFSILITKVITIWENYKMKMFATRKEVGYI